MPNATASGTFAIGGDLTVHRLGFGAMRITGSGIWGEPPDRKKALATLRAVPIPGTGDPDHLAGNAEGAAMTLSAEEFETLDREGRAG